MNQLKLYDVRICKDEINLGFNGIQIIVGKN